MIYIKYLSAVLLTLLLVGNVNSESLIVDSFESGDLSATNEDGFKWYNFGKISVVTAEAEVFKKESVNRPIPAGHDWTPKQDKHSLLFRYPVGESWIQQGFSIGKAYPELWMGFWLRVPTNYSHPENNTAADNQKLFALWMDGYSSKGEGSTVSMEFRGSGEGSSYFYGKVSRGGYTGTGSDQGGVPFIDIPGDRGRWMHLVVHVESESAPDESDGLMEVWRKWEDESDYTKTHDLKGQPIKLGSSVKGFSKGYLMGWQNAPYPVETEFLIDNFELATSPLFSDSAAPNSPNYLLVE